MLAFETRAAAAAVAAVLEAESVGTTIRAGQLVVGLEADFILAVPASLVHRARWVLAMLVRVLGVAFVAWGLLGFAFVAGVVLLVAAGAPGWFVEILARSRPARWQSRNGTTWAISSAAARGRSSRHSRDAWHGHFKG